MSILQQSRPAVYEWGTARPHDDTPNALRYEPLPAEGVPAAMAGERWTAEDRAAWLQAEMADARAERGTW